MTGDEISGLVDKVAEKLGVASAEVADAAEVLAAEYQVANLVLAACCASALLLLIVMGMMVRAGGRRIAKIKGDDEDWVVGPYMVSWVITGIAAVILICIACDSIYEAMMPRVALLAKLGLLR